MERDGRSGSVRIRLAAFPMPHPFCLYISGCIRVNTNCGVVVDDVSLDAELELRTQF